MDKDSGQRSRPGLYAKTARELGRSVDHLLKQQLILCISTAGAEPPFLE